MVDEYSSEQEQVEAIQKWLKTHGPSIVIGIAVGLAAIGGWRFWNSYQAGQAEQASAFFDKLSVALEDDDLATAAGQAEVLRQDYGDSAYAALASLLLAKQAVAGGDNATAAEELRWIVDNATQPELVSIARLRLARVLLAEQQPDQARAQLNQVDHPAYRAEIDELSGDIYLAAGQPEQARTAYQAAQTAAGPMAASGLLQLKLDNLPGGPPDGADHADAASVSAATAQ